MQMGFYESQLAGLSVLCISLIILERYVGSSNAKNVREAEASSDQTSANVKPLKSTILATLTRRYLAVYGIVMGKPSSQVMIMILDAN